MGLLVKPALVGAIKRPVCRLLLPRMTPSSFIPPPSLPSHPASSRVPLERERPGKLCEKRRLSSLQRCPLKFVGQRVIVQRSGGERGGRHSRRATIVKAAASFIESPHRNCRRSPTRNLARRKYGLMSSFFSSLPFFFFLHAF